jgi:hypothetical protein
MNLDNKHYVMIVLLLAALASLASIKVTYSKQVEQLTNEKKTLSDSLAIQRTETESLKKESESLETIEPVVLSNGQTAYVTRRTSKSIEQSAKQSTEQIAKLTQQITDLTVKLSQKTEVTVKPAPFWNVVASSSVIDYADVSQWQTGGGINIGALSLSLTNPLSLTLQPRLQAAIRF